ncbi:hypothetical protein [Amaricoccus tamworthensis]|uniref:hypothetical protein n=1 Tax=Amaricoccus tamworthensis TaxID=57002 RepID=UPI003C7A5B06
MNGGRVGAAGGEPGGGGVAGGEPALDALARGPAYQTAVEGAFEGAGAAIILDGFHENVPAGATAGEFGLGFGDGAVFAQALADMDGVGRGAGGEAAGGFGCGGELELRAAGGGRGPALGGAAGGHGVFRDIAHGIATGGQGGGEAGHVGGDDALPEPDFVGHREVPALTPVAWVHP